MSQSELAPLKILQALGIEGTPAITSAPGGFDTAIWKVEHEGQISALRVFQAGRHEECEREQHAMKTALVAGLPVPEIRKAGVWQDRPVLLISWLKGRTIEDELRRHPWRTWTVGLAFGRAQARLHATPAPTLPGQSADAWIFWQSEEEPALQDRLSHLQSSQATLLHLDYHPRNVLTDGKHITGIIDWTNAHAGDPRADVARTASILRVDPLARTSLFKRLSARVFEQAWRAGYQREHSHLAEMPLFYAWAGTVILHDQARRYKDNPWKLAPARRWTSKWKAQAGI